MSINFIIHSRLGQRRGGRWTTQTVDACKWIMRIWRWNIQPSEKGAPVSVSWKEMNKMARVLNAAQAPCVGYEWGESRGKYKAGPGHTRVKCEKLSWREVAGWHHITTIVLSSTIRILYSRTRGKWKYFKATPWRVNTKLNSSLQISEPGQLFTELQTLEIPSDKRKWLHS